jgi:tetratricopeptide (TPR) repeat protein
VASASGEDLTVTTWLNELDKQESETDSTSAIPAQEETPADQGDLPDWLKDMEKPTAPEAAKVESNAESDLPDWLRKSTVENESEQPPISEPIPEPAIEQEAPPWIEEPEEVAGLASPTAPEEWIPAEGSSTKADVGEAPEQPPVIVPIEPAVVPVTEKPVTEAAGMVAPIPAQNKDAEILSLAQNALENNSLNAAVKEYGKLIKRGHLIEEVIHDLREAVYRFPVDVIIWQTLGDAYMRANHLQDALDAYSKAEELLR